MSTRVKTHDLRFEHPFSLMAVGVSGSGKTSFCLNFLRAAHRDRFTHQLFTDTRFLQNIVIFYAEPQPMYDEFARENIGHCTWVKGPPSLETVEELCREYVDKGGSILLSDDHGDTIDVDLNAIVEKKRNHLKLSSLLIMHNLFSPNPRYRTLSRQVFYIVLFNIARDGTQISRLAQQMFPNDSTWLVTAFNDIMEVPYSYVLFDFTVKTPKQLRIRTNFLPTPDNPDPVQIVLYSPKT
jgi:hypothetical protein